LRLRENYHSLSDDDYYATLIAAAHERGLNVVHFEQDSPHFELSAEETTALEILAAIREVYSGTLAMSFVNADERLTFIYAFDVGLVTVFLAMYTSTDIMEDNQNPTLEQLEEINRLFLSFPQPFIQAGMPIYYIFVPASSDGQMRSEDVDERVKFQSDYQEQALYYEAFFNGVAETPYIRGFFIERWDWFDQYRRLGDQPGANYFDETLGASPRSKPAEDVIRAWFSIR
jgi:hypothetical protein